MKSIITCLFLPLLLLKSTAYAFTVQTTRTGLVSQLNNRQPTTFLQARKLSVEEQAKADMMWAGDWVCKDCGYIYDRVSNY